MGMKRVERIWKWVGPAAAVPLLLCSCAVQWKELRRQVSAESGCSRGHLTVREVEPGGTRLVVEGCGERRTYDCPRGRDELVADSRSACVLAEEPAAPAPVAAPPPAPVSVPEPETDSEPAPVTQVEPPPPEPEGRVEPPPPEVATAAAPDDPLVVGVRAALNTRRAAVLRCVSADRAVVMVEARPDGAVVVDLAEGEHTDAQVECVRALMDGVPLPVPRAPTRVVHMIRR